MLGIAARAALQTARGKSWAPLFSAPGGELMGYNTFRGRITFMLRDELRLGAAVTATGLRRAMVDYFMSGDFSDEQRAGARTCRRAARSELRSAVGTAPPPPRGRPPSRQKA